MQFKDPSQIKTGDGGNFLKVKNKETVSVVFRGEPYEFYSVFGSKSAVPEGTKGSKFRFLINAIVFEDGKFVAKPWEQGISVYKQLAHLNKEFGLEGKMKITRSGSGKDDTEYSILPDIKAPLSDAQKKQLDAVALVDLVALRSGDAAVSAASSDEIPF